MLLKANCSSKRILDNAMMRNSLLRINNQNICYYLGMTLGMVSFLKNESLWEFSDAIVNLLRYGGFFFLTIQLFISISKYNKKEIALFILFFFLTIIVGLKCHQLLLLLFTFELIMGCKGIYFKDIIKVYTFIGLSFCLITMFGSILGAVDNQIKTSTERGLFSSGNDRYSFGYGWTTNFANHVYFLLLSYWLIISEKFNFKYAILYAIIGVFIFIYTDCRLSVICIISIVIITYVIRQKYWSSSAGKLLKKILSYSVPIFVLISYYTTISFNPSNKIWFALNVILSARLSLGQDALKWAGIPMFGQEYEMYSGDIDKQFYNYIDNSYIQSLVIYGLIYTIVTSFLYVIICIRAQKARNISLIWGIFIAGASGIIAQHFIQIYMNPLLLALISKIEANDITKEMK